MCTYTYSYTYSYRRIHVCIEKYLSISILSFTDIVASIYSICQKGLTTKSFCFAVHHVSYDN